MDNKTKNGHLPSSMGWIAYKLQLWPGVRYGIGTMTNDLEEAEEGLNKTAHRMLEVLGIASTVKKGWRRIRSTFGGFGLFSYATEQLIERLNLLLQHYNTGSSLSKKLDASLRYLQLQLGTNICPLDLPYDTWSYLAPLSWVKMRWRTLQVSGFTVHLTYTPTPFPRRRDYLIMEYAMSKGATKEDLLSISRVRSLLCSIFVSDIVTVNVKYLDECATFRTLSREHASTYKFPKEASTQEDWITWRRFWKQHTVGNFELSTPLGDWIHPTHRVSEWYFDEEALSLQQCMSSGTCFYLPAPGYNRTRSGKSHMKI